MLRALPYTIISIGLILLHTSLMNYLAVGDVLPDIILLWIVYIALREGQLAGTAAGFLLGLILNFTSSSELLGLPALAKTFAGFVAGYFYNENKTEHTLSGYQFLLILAFSSIVHNLIYFLIFLQGSGIGWGDAVLHYGIATTIYTVVVGLVPMFVFARKYRS
jgi:rod shape-determining protein MreD